MPKRYRLGLDDVQLEAESLGYGLYGNGGVVERPEESKMGVTKSVVREDRR